MKTYILSNDEEKMDAKWLKNIAYWACKVTKRNASFWHSQIWNWNPIQSMYVSYFMVFINVHHRFIFILQSKYIHINELKHFSNWRISQAMISILNTRKRHDIYMCNEQIIFNGWHKWLLRFNMDNFYRWTFAEFIFWQTTEREKKT